MVKRTIGFGWTASGVSTALWRGVSVRDVLLACGLRETPPEERWYLPSRLCVTFHAADHSFAGTSTSRVPIHPPTVRTPQRSHLRMP